MTLSTAKFWTWIAVFAALHAGGFRAIAQQPTEAKQAEAKQTAEKKQPATPQNHVTRVMRVNHISAQEAYQLLSGIAGARFSNPLGVITVNGTPEQVDDFERMLREIDQPQAVDYRNVPYKNVVITVYFIGVTDAESPNSVPDLLTLQPVIDELRKHFPFKYYSLLETFAIRATQENPAEVEGVMPGSTDPSPTTYGFEAVIDKVTGEKGEEFVGFRKVRANWRVPIPDQSGGFNFSEVHMQTQLSVPASKMVVVGKAGAAGVSEGLFVVMRADVVP